MLRNLGVEGELEVEDAIFGGGVGGVILWWMVLDF